jgi:CelD/BcsL family acetyltransferase involved in cellulose biosynthesis
MLIFPTAVARKTGATPGIGQRARILEGPGILAQLGEEFDALALRCGAPITARRLWLETWIQSYRAFRPVAVCIFEEDQTLAGLALFAVRPRLLGTEVVALGDGASDHSRVYAIDDDAARKLAIAVKTWLRSLPRPWRMTLAQLPADDGAVKALQVALPHHVLLTATGSPMVLITGDRTPGRYITSNYRGQAKNKWNRMVKDGVSPKIEILTSAEEIAPVLPSVMAIAEIRQEKLTGRRKLDEPHRAAFFRAVVLEHARRGEVELMLLYIDGAIGAYSLTFRDGTSARMWSSHYDPRWSAYSPGHILSRALVERCVERPDIDVLDWMKGLEAYKLRTANHVEAAQSLCVWSGRGGRSAGRATAWLRALLQKTRARYPVLGRLQIGVRQQLGRIRGQVAAERGPEQ